MAPPANFLRDQAATFFKNPKRLMTTLVVGVVGMIVFLDAIWSDRSITPVASVLVNWGAVLVAFALLVGLLSVASSHVQRITQRDDDWPYSAVLLVAMLAVIVVGIIGVPGLTILFPQNLAEEPIRNFFHAVYEPLTSSLLALLAFFSLSTILRALQRRSVEVLLIVGVAFVVLVAQLPPVAALPMVSETVQWLNRYVALAGARGLLIGTAIGTLVASMRVLLGFDQPYLDN